MTSTLHVLSNVGWKLILKSYTIYHGGTSHNSNNILCKLTYQQVIMLTCRKLNQEKWLAFLIMPLHLKLAAMELSDDSVLQRYTQYKHTYPINGTCCTEYGVWNYTEPHRLLSCTDMLTTRQCLVKFQRFLSPQ